MSRNVLQIVGSRIKALRVARGLTQAQLAEITGYEPLTISRFERGAYGPSLEALYSIGNALKVDLGAFISSMNTEAFEVQTLRHEIIDRAYACSDVKRLRSALRSLSSDKKIEESR